VPARRTGCSGGSSRLLNPRQTSPNLAELREVPCLQEFLLTAILDGVWRGSARDLRYGKYRHWKGPQAMPSELLKSDDVRKLLKDGTPGKHADGRGLYLQIAKKGRASWTVQFRLKQATKWMSIGPADLFTLEKARRRHLEIRQTVHRGIDPRSPGLMVMASPSLIPEAQTAPVKAPATSGPLFGAVVTEYLDGRIDEKTGKHIPGAASNWKGDKEAISYRALISIDLAKLAADAITTEDVLSALSVWSHAPPTWEKYRARIAKVLDYCGARRYRPSEVPNPARLKGHIQHMSPPVPKAEEHHPALPYAELPQFMKELRALDTNESRALQWTILNTVRTADTIDATRSEIQGSLWVVPRERTKGKKGKQRDLHVPLSPQAMALLSKRGEPSDYLFPGKVKARMWHSSMLELLKELRPGRVLTVHGFRSTFRDWVSDMTDHDPNLAEIALHHAVGKKTERAYARSVMVEKRRKLMADWAKFSCGKDEWAVRM
jgi:integrase